MSRPRRRSRAELRRENKTRDAFLTRVSQGLCARVRALEEDPSELGALQGFARELAIAAAHGGELRFSRRIGGGTRAVVTLQRE